MGLKLTSFKTKDNLELPGLLYEPRIGSDHVLLYVHGNGSSSVFYDPALMNTLADQLGKKGIAFFPFNNRGAHYVKSFRIENGSGDGNVPERVKMGTAYELIHDCVLDIDSAIGYLESLGYQKFYLAGISTGANKIVVYNKYKKNNRVSKYILLSGGDDTGLYYQEMGGNKFKQVLVKCREMIKKGKGSYLVPKNIIDYLISYESLFDTLNPEGDYNIFPFNEYINNLALSKKKLFSEYREIDKPTLVIYGEADEYCYGDVPKCVSILKKECLRPDLFSFKIIVGADHGFNDREKELTETIALWLGK